MIRAVAPRPIAAPRAARRHGLMMVELLLGLTVTGLVGVAVAMMLSAMAYGTTSQAGLRETMVKLQTLRARFDAAVRSSRMVLEQGDDYLVLWIADTRADEKPNISEMRLIERDAETGVLTSYTADFPDGWTAEQIEAADTAYELNSDFAAATASLKAGPYFPGTLWAGGIEQWTITLNAQAQIAALIGYRLTTQIKGVSETAVGVVRLRNQG